MLKEIETDSFVFEGIPDFYHFREKFIKKCPTGTVIHNSKEKSAAIVAGGGIERFPNSTIVFVERINRGRFPLPPSSILSTGYWSIKDVEEAQELMQNA